MHIEIHLVMIQQKQQNLLVPLVKKTQVCFQHKTYKQAH